MSESFAAGLVGIVLDGRYRLDALLGEGGMGAVYRAHHLAMDRKVAVKLLKPHLTSDDNALQRFLREARSTMKVESDHAVKVLDFGITPQRDYYMVLEYLDGRTVQRELDVDGPFAPLRVTHIAKQALRALGAAHAAGLIHRDIKPDNILLMRVGDDPDYAKVLDFGVAKLMDTAPTPDRSAPVLTQAGMVFGTPEYMSPEQACGQTLDGRSDLYALAATMFAMLTGCGMYSASSPIEWLTHHARTPAPHLTDGAKELAPYTELDRVLQRCLAKRREDRPQTAQEMIAMLESIEPTLRAGGDEPAADSTARGHAMRAAPSSYIEALSIAPDPNATLLPGSSAPVGRVAATPDSPYARTMMPGSAAMPRVEDVRRHVSLAPGAQMLMPPSSADTRALPPTTTGVIAQVQSRRGVWVALGIASIAAVVVAVAVVATHHAPRAPERVVTNDKPIEAAPADAAVAITPPPPVDAAVAADAALPAEKGSAAPATRPKGNPKAAEVAKMITDAEAAQRAGNRLKQIAMADSALQIDPRNVRAKLLLADGLLATGDRERACQYLRELGKNAIARTRATQAGCP